LRRPFARPPAGLGDGGALATCFGRRRGKRYRLTADGLRPCERLLPGLLDDLDG
jgi:hypothetical protein